MTANTHGQVADILRQTVEVGPLANMLCKLAAGRESTQTAQ